MIPRWDSAWSKTADKVGLAKAEREDGTGKRRKKQKEKKISILPVLFRAFGPAYFVSSVLMFVLTFLYFAR